MAESTPAYVALVERQALSRMLDTDDLRRDLCGKRERALVVFDVTSKARAGKFGNPRDGGHAHSVRQDPAGSQPGLRSLAALGAVPAHRAPSQAQPASVENSAFTL